LKALVVDDDLALADVVSFTLRRAGYEVIVANDGQAAIDRWQLHKPDIILLDINMPKLNGLEVCQRIRAKANTPIIMLSVRSEEDDIVAGLKMGADDYIVKPFSPRQMVARVEAVLRRSGNLRPVSESLEAGGLRLDPSRNEAYFGEKLLARLTPLESSLLQVLLLNRDQVLPADTLIDHVWGPGGGDRPMLKQLVYRLRSKIETEDAGQAFIETVPAVGYSLVTKGK
jgi:DNA-binding response OmpR family regulator